MTDIYQLKLHESVLDDNGTVTRVPGGWIYHTVGNKQLTSVFVPFNNEFQPQTREPSDLQETP